MEPQTDETQHETIGVTDARQGRSGKRILFILLASAGAAALLMMAILTFAGPKLDASEDGETSAEASQVYDAS